MNNKFRLSIDSDSLEDSRSEQQNDLERLKLELKAKDKRLNEQAEIISSLRKLKQDQENENDDLEREQQLLIQKVERLEKQLGEKDGELESVWHVRKEVEKTLDTRTEQLKNVIKDLDKLKKELNQQKNDYLAQSEELQLKSERIGAMELELEDLRKRKSRERHGDAALNQLKKDLEVAEESFRIERQHKERYARENYALERKLGQLHSEIQEWIQKYEQLKVQNERLLQQRNAAAAANTAAATVTNAGLANTASLRVPKQSAAPHATAYYSSPGPRLTPPPPVKAQRQDENKMADATAAIHFSMADEIGEIMDSSSINGLKDRHFHNGNIEQHYRQLHMSEQYCVNHRAQKQAELELDPELEQKMRLERANELARRNMRTKPLHRTSYALELDTFDATGLTEQEIKRGNVNRQPLAPLQRRPPVKKAEAFIV